MADDIELTDEQEEALDAAWEKVGKKPATTPGKPATPQKPMQRPPLDEFHPPPPRDPA